MPTLDKFSDLHGLVGTWNAGVESTITKDGGDIVTEIDSDPADKLFPFKLINDQAAQGSVTYQATGISAYASALRTFHRAHCLFNNTGAYIRCQFGNQRHVVSFHLKRESRADSQHP